MIPQGNQIQIVLRTGQVLFITPPEQFNFTTFVLQCENDGYVLLANMLFIQMDVVAFMSMGQVQVGSVLQTEGMTRQ